MLPLKPYHAFFKFTGASFILYLETNYLIPFLHAITGFEIVLIWFFVAGVGMFLPLLIIALIMLKGEGLSLSKETWRARLRFAKITKTDLLWAINGFIIISTLSYLLMEGITIAFGEFSHQPPFMSFEPLGPGRYWILLLWLPYWVLNIMGEEILWRGVILPRQEKSGGKFCWLYHGLFWGIFHISFGWQLLITLIPILIILPYIVYKRKNSWLGVIIHAGLNGPSFIAIALGLI